VRKAFLSQYPNDQITPSTSKIKLLNKIKKEVQKLLTTEAKIAKKIGFTPNKISVIGFIFALASATAYLLTPIYSSWLLFLATFLLLASGFCDTLDGIVARTFGQTSLFGGFFDSVLDRYADAVVIRVQEQKGLV
jgi:phosphatidylglycerophosphate synthase